MKCNAILIIGPQGSGKGTQAKILAERLGFFYWEMGAVLREEHDWKFADGRTVGSIIDRGELLTDDQLLEVFKARATTIPHDKGIVFDGIPRRMKQAEFLLEFLKKQDQSNVITIFLDVPREESIRRLLVRAKIEGRADDSLDAIQFRLDQYNAVTLPVLEYLKSRTTFLDIDGLPAIPDVATSIAHKIESAS